MALYGVFIGLSPGFGMSSQVETQQNICPVTKGTQTIFGAILEVVAGVRTFLKMKHFLSDLGAFLTQKIGPPLGESQQKINLGD